MSIKTIKSIEELSSVKACWEGWQGHPNIDFDHFKLVCSLRSEVQCPYVTVIGSDGNPCTMMVARLEQSYFKLSIGYFNVLKIPAKVVAVLYQGLLGEVGEAAMQIKKIVDCILSGEADAVLFYHLPEDSPLLAALEGFRLRHSSEKVPAWSVHWEMDVSTQPGFLLSNMKSKHRSWIRGRGRKLEKEYTGKVSWRWMKRFDDIPVLFKQLESVAAKTYQRSLGAGFVDDREHRERFTLFANRNQLRIQLLEIEGEVKAFWIGIVYKGVFFSSETGYDPDLRAYEVGTLVFIRMVDELAREGVKKVDFGLGDAHYKKRFGNKFWRETTLTLFAPTLKGGILKQSLRCFKIVDRGSRRLLERTGLLDRIKTGWRRRLVNR